MGTLTAVPFLAALTLGNPFSDGTVLQRDRPLPVWGTADAGATVTVSFAGQDKTAVAGADGAWRVSLDPLTTSSEGRDLVVTATGVPVGNQTTKQSDNQAILHDVLVGEVWMVCGQSNMDVPLVGPNPRYRDGQGVAAAAVTHLPAVRWSDCRGGKWSWHRFETAELSRLRAFSAVAFYFAREVHQATGVPLGLVCAYCGGTNIEQWTPKCGYEKTGLFPELLNWKRIPEAEFTKTNHCGAITHWSKQPFMSFERCFQPVAPFAARGMIWYQGEQNAGCDRQTYDQKLHALLTGFETVFENPNLKFYMVQIPRPCSNPEFQMAQARFVKRHAADGRVKMAVISDIVNVHEVHPAEKEPVGRRLAYLALKYDYGFGALEAESPEATHAYAEGTNVHVRVAHAAALTVYNARLSFESRFEVAGADGAFHPAAIVNPLVTSEWGKEWRNGELAGGEIVVASGKVAEPKTVRYLHSRPYDSNVFNESGLPLGTFSLPVSPCKEVK